MHALSLLNKKIHCRDNACIVRTTVDFFVPRAGFEPARPCEHQPLKLACLPISTPGLLINELQITQFANWDCKFRKKYLSA